MASSSLPTMVKLAENTPQSNLVPQNYEMRTASQQQQQQHQSGSYTCLQCGLIMESKSQLDQHQLNVHRDAGLTCLFCDKKFPNKNSVKRHMQCVHEDCRPFKCQFCDKNFHSKWKQKRHEVIHTGDKRHACTYCGMRFGQNYHMQKHMRRHTGANATANATASLQQQPAAAQQHQTQPANTNNNANNSNNTSTHQAQNSAHQPQPAQQSAPTAHQTAVQFKTEAPAPSSMPQAPDNPTVNGPNLTASGFPSLDASFLNMASPSKHAPHHQVNAAAFGVAAHGLRPDASVGLNLAPSKHQAHGPNSMVQTHNLRADAGLLGLAGPTGAESAHAQFREMQGFGPAAMVHPHHQKAMHNYAVQPERFMVAVAAALNAVANGGTQ